MLEELQILKEQNATQSAQIEHLNKILVSGNDMVIRETLDNLKLEDILYSQLDIEVTSTVVPAPTFETPPTIKNSSEYHSNELQQYMASQMATLFSSLVETPPQKESTQISFRERPLFHK